MAAEISRRGAIASLFLTGTPQVDVVAFNQDLTRTIGIQVKTKGPGSAVWQWDGKKAGVEGDDTNEDRFIIFVELKSVSESLVYYVCPMREVATAVADNYDAYQARYKEKHGVWRKSTHASVPQPLISKWENRWDMLEIFETP